MRRRLSLTLLLLAGLFVPISARAFVVPAPAAPREIVHAGERMQTALPVLPAGLAEVELFLAPDDGSGRLIRLTAESDARSNTLRWRMPEVAAASGRLVLRAGGADRELESAPSERFAIAHAPASEAARLREGRSGYGWSLLPATGAARAITAPPGAAGFELGGRGTVATLDSRAPVARSPERISSRFEASVLPTSEIRCRSPRSNAPAFVPMRA